MAADYDSWHASLESVTIEMVLKTMADNVANIYRLLPAALPRITLENCSCRTAVAQALI